MARIFSMAFQFKGETFTAIITFVKECIIIKIKEPELQPLLPNGSFIYEPKKSMETMGAYLPATKDLIETILMTIKKTGKMHIDYIHHVV